MTYPERLREAALATSEDQLRTGAYLAAQRAAELAAAGRFELADRVHEIAVVAADVLAERRAAAVRMLDAALGIA